MNETPQLTGRESPEGFPPCAAILPEGLSSTIEEHNKARNFSNALEEEYNALSEKILPDVEPDQEIPKPDPKASLKLALLGCEFAIQQKKALQLEQKVVEERVKASLMQPTEADRHIQGIRKRYFSAGSDLWKHETKKARLQDDAGTVRLLDPRGNALTECLLAIYKKSDGLDRTKKRQSNWRRDALTYYNGVMDTKHSRIVWCHISGEWRDTDNIKTAHIVPHFMDVGSISKILFGDRAESLEKAGNSLLLSNTLKGWFDSYHIVVVPVDADETPITRWKTVVISPSIRKSSYYLGETAEHIDEKELTFRNEKRPVARFLYFHFIMALIRIKDLKRTGWEDAWAKFYTQRPFPTPGRYMRKSMLFALATHFGTTDTHSLESWIAEHGFDSPLQLTDSEAAEAARRVHETVEEAAVRAEQAAQRLEDGDESYEDSDDRSVHGGEGSEDGGEGSEDGW